MKSEELQRQQADTTTIEKNLMPSMVVRQQRIQMGTSVNQLHSNRFQSSTSQRSIDKQACQQPNTINNNHHQPNHHYRHHSDKDRDGEKTLVTTSVPTSSLIKAAKADQLNSTASVIERQQSQVFDQDGLILPKRVVHHPISVAQPIIRDLNRELKFNQIRGKNVLDQKSELKKVLEKLEVSKKKKEAEQERLSRRSSLELRLEERAERIAKETSNTNSSSNLLEHHHNLHHHHPGSVEGPSATTCKPLSNFSMKSLTR